MGELAGSDLPGVELAQPETGSVDSTGSDVVEADLNLVDGTGVDNHSPDLPFYETVDDIASTCPTAVIKCPEGQEVIPQTILHLIGSESFSSSSKVVKWQWSVQQPPLAGSVFVPSYLFPDPSFEANVAGLYEFSLDVWDQNGNKSCATAKYELIVTCSEVIHIELLWNTPGDNDETDTGPNTGSDLDLHFGNQLSIQPDYDNDGLPDPWFDSLNDCYWFNPQPNWGSFQLEVNDDPRLDRDDVDGGGPENLNFSKPETNASYHIGVHYWDDHGYGPAFATLRFYIYGALVLEVANVELRHGDLWNAATLHWPSGKVTQVVNDDNGHSITPNYPKTL